jgi:hypothetical protein
VQVVVMVVAVLMVEPLVLEEPQAEEQLILME